MNSDTDVDPHSPTFWTPLADTPAALEQHRVDAGEPWAVSALAGLQYYDWQQDDGMDGRYQPQPGDRLQLIREPKNPYDGNAVRVEWRNGVMLGHLPRAVAAEVATALDAGASLRGYVFDTGEEDPWNRAWQFRALLVGPPMAVRHGHWITGAAARLGQEIFGEPRFLRRDGNSLAWVDECRPPSDGQMIAAETWEEETRRMRFRRQADAAAALVSLIPAHDPLPEGSNEIPEERLRDTRFSRWDQVPPSLMTKTQMAQHGLRPVGAAFAHIRYYARNRWRRYDLYAVAEARPVRTQSEEARAAHAAAVILREAARYSDAPVL